MSELATRSQSRPQSTIFPSRAARVSAALRIDTLKFVRRLTEAGMERQMAEAIVEGLAEADMSEIATKAHIARVEAKIDTAVAELKAEMYRFMMLQAVAIVGLTVTLIKLLP